MIELEVNGVTYDFPEEGDTEWGGDVMQWATAVTNRLKVVDNLIVVQPSEGDAGIQTAINTLSAAGGGIVQLIEGIYAIDAGILPNAGINNITVQGLGDSTILRHDGILTTPLIAFQGTFIQSKSISNTALHDTKITYTTPADAGNVLAGDRIWIEGTDAWTWFDAEMAVAASNGNPTTGEVDLVAKIQNTLTTVTARSMRGGSNITLKDFRIASLGVVPNSAGIKSWYTNNFTINNVTVDTWDGKDAGTFDFSYYGYNNTVKNCNIKDTKTETVIFYLQLNFSVLNCHFTNISYAADFTRIYGAVSAIGWSGDIKILDNFINNSQSQGICVPSVRRVIIARNTVIDCFWENIYSGQNEALVCDNIIKNCWYGIALNVSESVEARSIIIKNNLIANANEAGISVDLPKNVVIKDNIVLNCNSIGIAVSGGEGNSVTGNTIRNCGNIGIWLKNSAVSGLGVLKTDVSHNVIDTILMPDWLGYGINLENACHQNTIVGNSLCDTLGTGIVVASNDNTIMGNHADSLGITISGTGNINEHNFE